MSLKLFRSTGYSTILTPGETRAGRHPGWVVLALSVWVGLACNVALWRALQSGGSADLLGALLVGVGAGAACATVLSLSGWRRTLKPMATALLLLAALAACGIHLRELPVDASLLDKRLPALMPAWPSLLRWQAPALLAALVLPPLAWMWSAPLRRMGGPDQLRSNLIGAAIGLALLAAATWLMRLW